MVVVEDRQNTYRVEWKKHPYGVQMDSRTDARWNATLCLGNDLGHERPASPRSCLEIGESVLAWRSVGGMCLHGMPHVTKIVRKPKGVGPNIKDLYLRRGL